MADNQISMNPWKLATIGLLLVGGTVMATTFVTGQKNAPEPSPVTPTAAQPAPQPAAVHKASSPSPAPARPQQAASPVPVQRAQPSPAIIEACNRYANEQVTGKTTEVLKDAGIGAVLGAAVGAATGAIADGGKGAGKGAAIGGIVGATGGTLFGLNENKANDEKYKAAYTSCMQAKGYPA